MGRTRFSSKQSISSFIWTGLSVWWLSSKLMGFIEWEATLVLFMIPIPKRRHHHWTVSRWKLPQVFPVIGWMVTSHFFLFSDPNLLVRACNQLGSFLQHRETNLRYLALESMCLLAGSEFSADAVKKHRETVINALKVLIFSIHPFLLSGSQLWTINTILSNNHHQFTV